MRPAALEYAARGWVAMPLKGKSPIVSGWQGLNPVIARGLTWPAEANIGILTGAVSGLVVLDVDPKHEGLDSLFELEMQHGQLAGPRVKTGSGGYHYYFKHPGPLVKVPNSVGKVGKGIDIRADGGQVCAPPSVHPETGNRYVWEKTGDVPPVPKWLLEKIGVQSASSRGRVRASRTRSEWADLIENGISSGSRNNTIAQLSGYLLRHLPEDIVLGLLTAWNESRCSPPLSEEEVNAVVQSIARKEGRG